MYSGYQQATLDSTHADNMLLTFEQNVQRYTDAAGYDRATGWYEDLAGRVQHYDVSENFWWEYHQTLNEAAEYYYQAAADAYDAYLSDCGY